MQQCYKRWQTIKKREFNKYTAKQIKISSKNNTGAILWLKKKNFEDEELPHELFLTKRQTTKIRNAFANNMSTDIKLSKAQISKIIQLGGSFGSWLGNLGRKALTNIAIPLARDNLLRLVSDLTSKAINKFDRKISGKGAVRAGKGFALFTSNEDLNDITKIIKSLEDLGVLIDGVTETVKDEIKKMCDCILFKCLIIYFFLFLYSEWDPFTTVSIEETQLKQSIYFKVIFSQKIFTIQSPWTRCIKLFMFVRC